MYVAEPGDNSYTVTIDLIHLEATEFKTRKRILSSNIYIYGFVKS